MFLTEVWQFSDPTILYYKRLLSERFIILNLILVNKRSVLCSVGGTQKKLDGRD
jgi:hypothetical protein